MGCPLRVKMTPYLNWEKWLNCHGAWYIGVKFWGTNLNLCMSKLVSLDVDSMWDSIVIGQFGARSPSHYKSLDIFLGLNHWDHQSWCFAISAYILTNILVFGLDFGVQFFRDKNQISQPSNIVSSCWLQCSLGCLAGTNPHIITMDRLLAPNRSKM